MVIKKLDVIPIAQRKAERRGIKKEWIEDAVRNPSQVLLGFDGRKVAQKKLLIEGKEERGNEEGNWTTKIEKYCHEVTPSGERGIKMRIEYDPKHDLLNIEFMGDETIAESLELDGIIIDYSRDRRIVAIEILDAGKRTATNPLDMINLSIVKEKAIV